jgi:hypothetical protein
MLDDAMNKVALSNRLDRFLGQVPAWVREAYLNDPIAHAVFVNGIVNGDSLPDILCHLALQFKLDRDLFKKKLIDAKQASSS